MKEKLKDLIVIVAGWIFIVLGIAGLFLPVLQGILFLMFGLYLLSRKTPWARTLLYRLRYRYPRIFGRFKEVRKRTGSYFANIHAYFKKFR